MTLLLLCVPAAFISAVIIGLSIAIIALMLIIAGLVHVFYRRSKRRAEIPVRYSNHTHHANHNQPTSSNNSSTAGSNGCSAQSTSSMSQTCVIPMGKPPAPPSPCLYSEVCLHQSACVNVKCLASEISHSQFSLNVT